MVDGSDARSTTFGEPERLFACDPELVALRALLDRDEPPDGAVERVLARTESAGRARRRGQASRFVLKVAMLVGTTLLVGDASEGARPATVVTSEVRSSEQLASSNQVADAPASDVAESVSLEVVRVEDLPSATASSVTVSSLIASSALGASASPLDAFELELALVERARTALAKGRGRDCLDVTAQYRTKFSNGGRFDEEIEVMRIEALAMTGLHAQARTRAARFLERHGASPYAERLRRFLESSAGEP